MRTSWLCPLLLASLVACAAADDEDDTDLVAEGRPVDRTPADAFIAPPAASPPPPASIPGADPELACATDADCIATTCGDAACVLGQCTERPLAAGVPCDAAGRVCNGAGQCTDGRRVGFERIGGAGHQFAFGVVADPDETIVLAEGLEEATGNDHAFVWRRDDGSFSAARGYLSPDDTLVDLARLGSADDDDVVVSGCRAKVDAADVDALLQRVGPEGRPAWTMRFGGSGAQCAEHVAVDADGTLWVAGSFQGELGLAGIVSPRPASFLARFSPTGVLRWVGVIDAPWATVEGLEVVRGDVVVGGTFEGTLTLPGGVTPSITAVGGADAWIARWSPTGGARWITAVGDRGWDRLDALAATGDTVAIAGARDRTDGPGPDDVFVARLDAPTGAIVWTERLEPAARARATAITVGPFGDIVAGGTFQGDLEGVFGATRAEGTDGFVVALAGRDGTPLWGHVVGGPGWQDVTGLATAGRAALVAVGSLEGHIGAATPPTAAPPSGLDGYVLRLAP
ncbi:MAG: hypothetical protein AAF928_07445 [Myxococcota bacterium]